MTMSRCNMIMTEFRLTSKGGFAEVKVSFAPGGKKWTLAANFVPLEQREFVDALDRALPFEAIAKDGRGGCIIFGFMPENMGRPEVLERIIDVFEDTIKD